MIFSDLDPSHFFFGYYDKSPFNINDSLLLAQRSSFSGRMPKEDDLLDIGYFELGGNNLNFNKVTETRAWNWQQGCMLQWLGPDYNKKVIYNDRLDNKFVSVILDIETREKFVLPMAVYSVHPNGRYALCIDNERHYWFRGGYNYQGIVNPDKNVSIDDNDGIWLMEIPSGRLRQIINIKDLLAINPISNMGDGPHYLEHLMFSPSGDRFLFLHRWQIADGSIYARLYSANINGDDLCLLNDSGRMSHFSWRNDTEILAYCGLMNALNSLRKYSSLIRYFIYPLLPLYHKIIQPGSSVSNAVTGDSYVLFGDCSSNRSRIATDLLLRDGHPTFCPSNLDWFISDTYQDESGFRELFLYNVNNNQKILIDRVHSDSVSDNTGYRCDLHPKWSYSGRYISIDLIYNGKRQMAVYDVSDYISN